MEYSEILVKVIELVIMICAVIVSRYLIPWLKTNGYYQKLKTAKDIAVQLVIYAEKIIVGEKKGEERFEYVTSLLSPIVKKLGLDITDEQIKSLVQTAYENTYGFY